MLSTGKKIARLNDEYIALDDEFGATYLDLWPLLSDSAGALRNEYTLDNLHLNGLGYKSWAGILRPLI